LSFFQQHPIKVEKTQLAGYECDPYFYFLKASLAIDNVSTCFKMLQRAGGANKASIFKFVGQ
jgi:hypothetical protein